MIFRKETVHFRALAEAIGDAGMSYGSAQRRVEAVDERRGVRRQRSGLLAVVRQLRRHNDTVHLVDISTDGCGFKSAWALPAGTRVWLSLPGLETWPATVAWFEAGMGGLDFEQPLHPVLAECFAAAAGD